MVFVHNIVMDTKIQQSRGKTKAVLSSSETPARGGSAPSQQTRASSSDSSRGPRSQCCRQSLPTGVPDQSESSEPRTSGG